jgi:Branched-chain amino acid ABC-type transport system, permease components
MAGWVIGQSVVSGLLMGGVYAMIAVGLTIIFGVMKMVNFAQGDFLMVGMYVTYVLNLLTGWNAYVLIIPVMIIMSLIAFFVFKVAMKPILGRDSSSFILVTFGLSFFLQGLSQLLFTAKYFEVPSPIKNDSLTVGSFSIGVPRLIACLSMILVVAMVWTFLNRTNFGRAMRATAENTDVAKILGINTDRTFLIAFVIGIAMAGLSGVLITPIYMMFPKIGSAFTIYTMVVIILGGLGNILGAFLGGFLVGMVEAFTGSMTKLSLAPAGVYVLLLIVLYLRPQGIFGKKERSA